MAIILLRLIITQIIHPLALGSISSCSGITTIMISIIDTTIITSNITTNSMAYGTRRFN